MLLVLLLLVVVVLVVLVVVLVVLVVLVVVVVAATTSATLQLTATTATTLSLSLERERVRSSLRSLLGLEPAIFWDSFGYLVCFKHASTLTHEKHSKMRQHVRSTPGPTAPRSSVLIYNMPALKINDPFGTHRERAAAQKNVPAKMPSTVVAELVRSVHWLKHTAFDLMFACMGPLQLESGY